MAETTQVTAPTPMLDRMAASLAARLSKVMYLHMGKTEQDGVDFSSNDYLSLSHVDSPFHKYLQDSKLMNTKMATSSTGSRLLSGNTKLAMRLEELAAEFHIGESALAFNSGFDANLAVLSSVLDKGDVFIYDQLVHASMHDGMRLSKSKAKPIPFKHNSVDALRETILGASKVYPGNMVVCVETVYSMDGDMCPIKEMLDVCKELGERLNRNIYMIADEAHSGGIFGPNGEGYVVAHNVHKHPNLLARTMTFGKAFASHGAVVICPQVLKEFLYNYGRSFIFSTSLAPHSVAVMHEVYGFMQTEECKLIRERMWRNVDLFAKLAREHLPEDMLLPTMGESPIQVILMGTVARGDALNKTLLKAGYTTYPIGPPAVPRGQERIRIIVHGGNTEEEIEGMVMTVKNFLEKYEE